jgi:hypothetical protein
MKVKIKYTGAGEENRTPIASLEGWSFTTKLHLQMVTRVGIEPTTHRLKVCCSTD